MRLLKRLAFAAVILGFGAGLAWAGSVGSYYGGGWGSFQNQQPQQPQQPQQQPTLGTPQPGNVHGGSSGTYGSQTGGAQAPGAGNGDASLEDYDICELIRQLSDVFKILRILCFGGAAFVILGWAWGFITSAEIKMDDVKKKGVSLILSFILLFGVGTLLTYLPGVSTCDMSYWN